MTSSHRMTEKEIFRPSSWSSLSKSVWASSWRLIWHFKKKQLLKSRIWARINTMIWLNWIFWIQSPNFWRLHLLKTQISPQLMEALRLPPTYEHLELASSSRPKDSQDTKTFAASGTSTMKAKRRSASPPATATPLNWCGTQASWAKSKSRTTSRPPTRSTAREPAWPKRSLCRTLCSWTTTW